MKKIFICLSTLLSALILTAISASAEGVFQKTLFCNIPIHSVIAAIIILLLIGLPALVYLKKKGKASAAVQNALLDPDTGIGNLGFFQYRFNNIVDSDRTKHYIAYIVLDDELIKSRFDEQGYSDTVKYTANLLKNDIAENEFAARIEDAGFAFEFMASNKNDACKKLENIIDRLNSHLNIDSASKETAMYATLYNLRYNDRDLSFILFNLHRNVNSLFANEQKLLLCDYNLMHKSYEDKQMHTSLLEAMQKGEFALYLQFIVENPSKNLFAAESLSRWKHPDKGLLLPNEYMPFLEANNLIEEFDYYMFDKVCSQLCTWKGTKYNDTSVSCNFSRITIAKDDFIDNIKSISEKYAIDKSKLIIEITESALENNLECALRNMRECKNMGFTIALDDLGTGDTSLINLCEYPVDIVKLSKDLLINAESEKGRLLLDGVINTAHSLGLKVICEGVETDVHNDIVTGLSSDYAQGFYYYFPVDAEKTVE